MLSGNAGTTLTSPGRETGLRAQFADPQPTQRRAFGGFEHHRVPHGQSRRDLDQRRREGQGRRRHERHHPDRIVEVVRALVGVEWMTRLDRQARVVALGVVDDEPQMVQGREDLEAQRLEERLALLASDELGQMVALLVDQRGQACADGGHAPRTGVPRHSVAQRAADSTAWCMSSGPAQTTLGQRLARRGTGEVNVERPRPTAPRRDAGVQALRSARLRPRLPFRYGCRDPSRS